MIILQLKVARIYVKPALDRSIIPLHRLQTRYECSTVRAISKFALLAQLMLSPRAKNFAKCGILSRTPLWTRSVEAFPPLSVSEVTRSSSPAKSESAFANDRTIIMYTFLLIPLHSHTKPLTLLSTRYLSLSSLSPFGYSRCLGSILAP